MMILARRSFVDNNRKSALDKLKEMIVYATQNDDFTSAASCFVLCSLIEYFHRDFASACDYLIQLVRIISEKLILEKCGK